MLGVEKTSMGRGRAGARSAVQKNDGQAARIARLLPIEGVGCVELEHAGGKGLDRRKQILAIHPAVLARRRWQSRAPERQRNPASLPCPVVARPPPASVAAASGQAGRGCLIAGGIAVWWPKVPAGGRTRGAREPFRAAPRALGREDGDEVPSHASRFRSRRGGRRRGVGGGRR